MPINESVDVDFADPRGKMYDRTRFDFTVTRSHNFVGWRILGHRSPRRRRPGRHDANLDLRAATTRSSTAGRFRSSATARRRTRPAAAAAGGRRRLGSKPAAAAEARASARGAPAAAGRNSAPTRPDPAAQREGRRPSSHGCGCRMVEPGVGRDRLGSCLPPLALVRRARRRRASFSRDGAARSGIVPSGPRHHGESRLDRRHPKRPRPSARDPARGAARRAQRRQGRRRIITLEATYPFGPAMTVQKYRLGNGLTVLVSVDTSAPVVSYHTWFARGLAPREAGQDRARAPLRAPDVQRDREASRRASSIACSRRPAPRRNAATWVDWTYYHESSRKDRLGLVDRAREPSAWRKLVLREPQVDERERGRRQRAALPRRRRRRGRGERAALQDGVHDARLPLADHRLDGRHRGLHHRRLRRVLQDLLRAQQRDGRRGRRRQRAGRARARSRRPTARSRAPTIPVEDMHARAAADWTSVASSVKKPTADREDRHRLPRPRARRRRPRRRSRMLNEVLFRRPLVALSPRAHSGAGDRHRAARLGRRPSAIPGSTRSTATARDRQHGATSSGGARRASSTSVRRRTGHRSRARQGEGARSSSRCVQGLETASGKAEQIGFYDTVLGDPVGAFSTARSLPPHSPSPTAAGRAPLPRRRARAPSSKCIPRAPMRKKRSDDDRPADRRTRCPVPRQPVIYVEESHALPLVSIVVAFRSRRGVTIRWAKKASRGSMVRMLRRGCRGLTSQRDRRADRRARRPSSRPTSRSSVITLARRSHHALARAHGRSARHAHGRARRSTRSSSGGFSARPRPRSSRRATATASLATRHFRRVLFDGHPYGRRIGGSIASISRAHPRRRGRGHYQQHFSRGNVAVAFSGDITEAQAARALRASGWPDCRRQALDRFGAAPVREAAAGTSSSSTSPNARRRRSWSARARQPPARPGPHRARTSRPRSSAAPSPRG